MSFDDEIIKLLRQRSVYLDFSHSNNPGAADWPDPAINLFGKSPDSRGPIPIIGTVDSFGTFNRSVVNLDFAFEIPNLTVELIDPDHFWRARAQPDPALLMYRWVNLFLRVIDDSGNPYDQRIAVGQVHVPDFPARKRVSLPLELTGGKWLGETIPRRTVTLYDFPRAAPEEVGKGVPIIFGVLSNDVIQPGTAYSPGCGQKQNILIQESWSNGNGIAFHSGDGGTGNYNSAPSGSDPVDTLYPTLAEAEAVWVYPDYFDYGVNALWVHPDWDPTAPNSDWVVGAAAFMRLGDLQGDGILTQAFDATEMWARFTYYPDENPLEDDLFCPLYTIWRDAGFEQSLEVMAVGYGPDLADDPDNVWIEVSYGLWGKDPGDPANSMIEHEVLVKWGSRAELLDTKQEFVVCHKCGTYTYDPDAPGGFPGFGEATVADDGYLRIYCNGKPLLDLSGIPLVMNYGHYEEAGNDASNRSYTVSFGYYGLVGPLTNILVTAGVKEEEPPKCGDDASVGQAMASGALRALLVDTGGVTDVSGTGVPSGFTPDTSMPTVTGHEAHNIFGGGTIAEAVFFYVAAMKADGTIGPISAIVDLDNAYDPDQEPHAASLSWVQAGDATAYIVWMSTSDAFHPVSNPTVGNPRTKTISAQNGSSFPPIAGPPFDYQVIFTSLQDGDAHVEESTEGPYRYLLAGHWLKAVDQVYVLKPVATVTPDSDVNTLTGPVLVGATTATVVFNDTADRFRADQVVIFAGDPEPYTITGTDDGTLTFDPPARKDFATGTTVSSTSMVDTQVLQVEGEDYIQEVIEINGNRYHTLVFAEPQQNPETCEQYEVTANVQGTEINADGTGQLITDGVSIVQHFFKNWIFNDYRSSVGPYAPPGGKWFEDVAYAPGLINNTSFYEANLVSSGRVDGNYQGAGALTDPIPATQLIHDLITSFDLDLYYDTSTGQGAWSVKMLNLEALDRDTMPAYTPTDDIIKDSFLTRMGQTPHANAVQYFAAPMLGTPLQRNRGDGYILAGEVRDDQSIARWGQKDHEPLYLKWTRHPATAYDVAFRRLVMTREPSVHAVLTVPVGAVNDALASEVKITHPDGLGASGWTDRVCRIMRADLDLDAMVIHLLLRDIDPLVAP